MKPSSSVASSPIDLKDPKAFEAIYNDYWKRVYTTCYRHVNDTEVCKEMVQDIFKSLWERRHELVITVSVEHYLARAAKFKVFEYIRNKATQERHKRIAVHEYSTTGNYTEQVVMFNALKEDVATIVHQLPSQCRRVFQMSRVDGMSNRDIAASLAVSERAVEHHITKALRTLRPYLLGKVSTAF